MKRFLVKWKSLKKVQPTWSEYYLMQIDHSDRTMNVITLVIDVTALLVITVTPNYNCNCDYKFLVKHERSKGSSVEVTRLN